MKNMTPEAVRAVVGQLKCLADDDETAHGIEDGLWESVLETIADGAADPHVLAKEALLTREIDFERWKA